MNAYQRDEFDNVPESSSRQGVHRVPTAQPKTGWLPIVGFALLAVLVGASALFFIPRFSSSIPGPSSSPTAPSQDSMAEEQPTDAYPSTDATKEENMPSSGGEASPSASSDAGSGTVDKSQPVGVFNAIGVPGLASKITNQLKGQGWTVPQSNNWPGPQPAASAVLYKSAELKSTAEQLASSLGFPARLDNTAAMPLVVLLGPGAK